MDEKEYIEREALLKKLDSDLARWADSAAEYKEDKSGLHAMQEAILYVIAAPAADVVEVVRCKDCIHFLNDTAYCRNNGNRYCEYDEVMHDDEHFCSYGERKEQDHG